MLQYHDLVINQNTEKQEFAIQLDLSYLINLQNLGYEVMKYYRLEQNSYAQKVGLSIKEQMVHGVNDIKLLINSVY